MGLTVKEFATDMVIFFLLGLCVGGAEGWSKAMFVVLALVFGALSLAITYGRVAVQPPPLPPEITKEEKMKSLF